MRTEREAIEEMTGKKRIATVRTSKPRKGEHIYVDLCLSIASIATKLISITNTVVILLVTHSKAGVILCRFCTILNNFLTSA